LAVVRSQELQQRIRNEADQFNDILQGCCVSCFEHCHFEFVSILFVEPLEKVFAKIFVLANVLRNFPQKNGEEA
jgi:hypothetical protein